MWASVIIYGGKDGHGHHDKKWLTEQSSMQLHSEAFCRKFSDHFFTAFKSASTFSKRPFCLFFEQQQF